MVTARRPRLVAVLRRDGSGSTVLRRIVQQPDTDNQQDDAAEQRHQCREERNGDRRILKQPYGIDGRERNYRRQYRRCVPGLNMQQNGYHIPVVIPPWPC
jgi:hypothetical protein